MKGTGEEEKCNQEEEKGERRGGVEFPPMRHVMEQGGIRVMPV